MGGDVSVTGVGDVSVIGVGVGVVVEVVRVVVVEVVGDVSVIGVGVTVAVAGVVVGAGVWTDDGSGTVIPTTMLLSLVHLPFVSRQSHPPPERLSMQAFFAPSL